MTARKVKDIEYFLLPGSERKTTDIVIERDGKVTVRPPKSLSPNEVDKIVSRKRIWIYKNLAEWKDLNSTKVLRRWVNGESFLYLGKTYRLKLVSRQKENLKIIDGKFLLKREIIEKYGEVAAKKVFEEYYTERGIKKFQAKVKFYAPKVGVVPNGISVGDIGFKWGSCSKSGKLSFHWKAMMAKPSVIDYIVVHELCHMHFRDHTEAFWNEVDKVMPNYLEKKNWLKQNGAGFDL